MKKFLLYSFLLILSTYFLVNTLRILYHLYEVEGKTIASKTELKQIESENQKLKDQLSDVKSNYFLEKEARDKFLLKKPNEEVYVIKPQNESDDEENETKRHLPNWKKWYELIFG